jgi:hypothetical protein
VAALTSLGSGRAASLPTREATRNLLGYGRLRSCGARATYGEKIADVQQLDADHATVRVHSQTDGEMCALLGAISERTWFRMKKGKWPRTLSQDQMTRVSALTGIFKGLRLLFSLPLADEWIRLPNKNPLFGGRRPLDVMIGGGIPAMLEVRHLVDALRGGL